MQIKLPQSLNPGLSFSHYSNYSGQIKAGRTLMVLQEQQVRAQIIAVHKTKPGCSPSTLQTIQKTQTKQCVSKSLVH